MKEYFLEFQLVQGATFPDYQLAPSKFNLCRASEHLLISNTVVGVLHRYGHKQSSSHSECNGFVPELQGMWIIYNQGKVWITYTKGKVWITYISPWTSKIGVNHINMVLELHDKVWITYIYIWSQNLNVKVWITLVIDVRHEFFPPLPVTDHLRYLYMSLVLWISLIDILNHSHPATYT